MKTTKRYFQVLALAALLALGGLTAVALAHFGTGTITCTKVTLSYSSFPSSGSNNITETVTANGTTIYNAHFTFSGSSASHVIAVSLTGSQTVVAHASWNGNGVSGSYDSGEIHLACTSTSTTTTGTTVTTTVPTTTVVTTTVPTRTVTVTVPVVTVTTPAQTVIVTQTTPAPPASTVTTTLPAVTTVKIVKSKPRVVVRTKWVTIHHVSPAKTVTVTRCKPHHLSPEETCRNKGGIWNGHGCGFAGTG